MDVRTIPLSDIRPYHRNPQEHTDKSSDALQESIRKFGFRVPVVLDSDDTIVTGHGRFQAVQQLEGELTGRIERLREVDRDDLADNLAIVNEGKLFVTYEQELDGRTLDEFRISDNKIAEESDWDFDLLESELETLDTDDVVGYTDEDLAGIIEDFEVEADDEPELDDSDDEFDDTVGATEEDEPVVELVCPECLESVEVDAEIALREFEILADGESA